MKNDENALPAQALTKTIHQRNKSSPALSSMLAAGGLRAAAKRTAFGDLSNIVQNSRPSKDDTSISIKHPQSSFQEDQPLFEKKPAAFLRPAQRPLSVAGLKGLLTGSSQSGIEQSMKPAAEPGCHAPNTRRVLIKRNTTIFKDPSLDTVNEVESSAEARPKTAEATVPNENRRLQSVVEATHQQPLLPSPPRQAAVAGDPIKETQPLDIQLPLPLISQVLQQPPALLSEIRPEAAAPPTVAVHQVTTNQEPEKKATHQVAPITTTTSESLYSHHQLESYFPQQMRSRIPSAPVPALLPQLPQHQTVLPQEVEEHWEEDDEEPYEEEGYVTARSYRSRSENTTGGATAVLFPQYNQKVRREISAAKSLVEATRTADEIEDESFDTSMVAEYGEEIFDYMRELEVKMLPNAHYMDNQHEIQWSMRAVLMDWLVQVHHRFNLLPETLYLCVNYIDRFLSAKVVSLGKLQLVGATAIFIAAKYEEINCPSVQEIVYMVDGGYTIDEVLKAERFMLTMLQFELGWPGPMSFLRRISKADDYDLETRTLAKYFLEVTIMDERFIGSPPSFTAAASHCLARLMLRKGYWVSKS